LLRLQEAGAIFVVVEYRIHYRSLARYDDALTIEVRPIDLKRVRLIFNYRVLKPNGEAILDATASYACTDLDGKPARVPAELVTALEPWLAESVEA
jgi:YbgC/YbaW family acyl-CoA thioester hydrolase